MLSFYYTKNNSSINKHNKNNYVGYDDVAIGGGEEIIIMSYFYRTVRSNIQGDIWGMEHASGMQSTGFFNFLGKNRMELLNVLFNWSFKNFSKPSL